MIDAVDEAIRSEEHDHGTRGHIRGVRRLDPTQHDAAVVQRWPGEAYAESKHRTARCGKDQWLEIRHFIGRSAAHHMRGAADRIRAGWVMGIARILNRS